MFKLISYILTIIYVLTDAVYILDNGIDVRIVADDNEFCNIGRIEFYDGINWGSFNDCSHRVTHDIANSICQTLGWDRAENWNHGPYQINPARTIPKYISYSNIYCPSTESEIEDICDYDIDNHNDLFDCDICVNCQISNKDTQKQCLNISKNEIHSKYDIYIMCNNENNEANPASNLYNCTDYVYEYNTTQQIYDNEEWHLDMFGSCADAYKAETDKHSNIWKFLVVATVLIVAGICMFLYCKSTTRMPHKKFTDAYMANMDNDNDINMMGVKTKQTVNVGSNYTSLSRERKLSASKERLIED